MGGSEYDGWTPMIKLHYKTKVMNFVDIIKVPNQLTLSLSKNKSKITLWDQTYQISPLKGTRNFWKKRFGWSESLLLALEK